MRVTRIGGPTVLVELDGWRILVDPTFDPPGRRYAFALGTSSVKTAGPAISADEVGPVDVVLVSHDHHADNLDDAGRRMLATTPIVLTTASGAGRLGIPQVRGLRAGEVTALERPERRALDVTATPCRHGPPLSRLVVGDVVGFAVRRRGHARVALWVVGDTVAFRGVRTIARAMDVDVAIVNAGGVGFPLTGPLRYTMTGPDVVDLVAEMEPRVAVVAHYEGWSHFLDGEDGMRGAVLRAPAHVRERILILPAGQPTDVDVSPASPAG